MPIVLSQHLVYPSRFSCYLCICVSIVLSQHTVYPSMFSCCLCICVPIVLSQHFGSFFFTSTLFVEIWSKKLEIDIVFVVTLKVWKVQSLHCYLWSKVKVKKMLLSVNLNDKQVSTFFQCNMAICLSIHFPSVYLPSYFYDVCVCVEQIHFNHYFLSPCI